LQRSRAGYALKRKLIRRMSFSGPFADAIFDVRP
jgi:hypothetical protein